GSRLRVQVKKCERKVSAGTLAIWATLQSTSAGPRADVLFRQEDFRRMRWIVLGLCRRRALPPPAPDIPANCEITIRTGVAEQLRRGSPVSRSARNIQDCRCPRWKQKTEATGWNL